MKHLSSRPCSRTRAAFTLIELLTVIAIIGILAAILIPTVGKVRNTAKKAQCIARLRQWGAATGLCASENRSNIALFFKSDPFTYSNYLANGKNMNVDSATGVTTNKTLVDAMSVCPTGINGDNSLNGSVRQYAFVIPVGLTAKKAGAFHLNSDEYFYATSDAAAPSKLLLMIEVANLPQLKPATLSDIQTVLTADNSTKKMQTTETYIRHGGLAHGLFVDGHVGSLSRTDTDYTQSKDTLDRYFTLK